MAEPRLNLPMILETPERQGDGAGGYRTVWQVVGQLWAGLSAVSGAERSGQAGAQSVVTWRIVTRGAPEGDPRRPRPEQRLRMGLRLFRIDAVAERDGDGRYLTCFAREEKRT
ncbi:head-tail adaptor protein [Paracoccus zhejiangensis]|uniref:Phage tail protein n=1 Tax=Paracoccus zhejiangensis TaxID=1077935 RepID=A0A2H5EV17_9RHOB|nr:head-tail adaptor protein [Paracoccus zhejiangensis]AUH63131.1 phage tail protein [Paracoccus zhejiangensis]